MNCPLQDSVLRIHYKTLLPDDGGRLVFDSRSNSGEPIVFASGEGVVRGPSFATVVFNLAFA